MGNLEKLNDEVFVARDGIVRIGPADVQFIKTQAAANRRRRARICAHRSGDDPLHEMLIAIAADSYIPPHKHPGKSESFHIVEGAVDIVVFDDEGEIVEVLELGDPATGKPFFYRLGQSAFHTLLIKNEILVVHEVTNGPFSRSLTILPAWAPPEERLDEARSYMDRVLRLAEAHKLAAGTRSSKQ